METNKITNFNPVLKEVDRLDKRFEQIHHAMKQDELIEKIEDNYSAKTTYEEWGRGVNFSQKYLLPSLHWISALSAFMGVFSVCVVICLLIPFANFEIINGISVAKILGFLLTVGVLYLIEIGKTFSIKITVPKWLNPVLRTQYKERLPFYFGFVVIMVVLSFVTSFFGGIETPAAVTKEPERKQAAIKDVTGTTEKSLSEISNLTSSYDSQIEKLQNEKNELEKDKDRNEASAKAKRRANGKDTGWREQLAANQASKNAKETQSRIDKLMQDKKDAIQSATSLASAGISTINKANEIELQATNELNKRNYEDYASKIKKSSWAMGAISLSTDFLIILLEYLILYYQWVCGKEFQVIGERLNEQKQGETVEKQPSQQPLITNDVSFGELVAAGSNEKEPQMTRMSKREFLDFLSNYDEACEYNGKIYTPSEISTIISNIGIYFSRANKPIPNDVTGENAEAAKKARVENANKVKEWTAILTAAGVEVVTNEQGIRLMYPFK